MGLHLKEDDIRHNFGVQYSETIFYKPAKAKSIRSSLLIENQPNVPQNICVNAFANYSDC